MNNGRWLAKNDEEYISSLINTPMVKGYQKTILHCCCDVVSRQGSALTKIPKFWLTPRDLTSRIYDYRYYLTTASHKAFKDSGTLT